MNTFNVLTFMLLKEYGCLQCVKIYAIGLCR